MGYKEGRIYCPQCHRHVADYDGKSSANIEVKCNKCNKLVVFKPQNGSVSLVNMPKRLTAGGKRFY